MRLEGYVDGIERQLAVAASIGGPEVVAVAENLIPALRSAVRLALLESLASAADELTLEMATGSVSLRMHGGDPTFVLEGLHSAPSESEAPSQHRESPIRQLEPTTRVEEGASSRINLRLPDSLKARVEVAAANEGRSVNTWLIRAASSALEPAANAATNHPTPPRRASSRVTGWAR
jgi:hypothetical protein